MLDNYKYLHIFARKYFLDMDGMVLHLPTETRLDKLQCIISKFSSTICSQEIDDKTSCKGLEYQIQIKPTIHLVIASRKT